MHGLFAASIKSARFVVGFANLSGVVAAPPGTAFSRASDGYWYPTGPASNASLGKAPAGNNTLLVGNFGGVPGARINPATTNALPTENDPTVGNGWAAGTAPAPTLNDAIGPDGTLTASRLQPAAGEFSNYYGAVGAAGRKAASYYGSTKAGSAAQQETAGTAALQQSSGWIATAGVWQRRVHGFNDGDGSPFYSIPSDGRDKTATGGVAAAAHDLEFWGGQTEIGHQHATDLVPGGATRAGERFWLTAVPANIGGRLILSIQFQTYAAMQDLDAPSRVWTTAAGDYAEIDPVTRQLTISVGGVAYPLPVPMSCNPYDVIRIATVAGNGQSLGFYSVNGSPSIELGATAGTHAAMATPAALDVLSSGTTKQLSSLLQLCEVW